MAALNDMEVINVDDFKSRKQKRKHAPLILLNQCLDRVMEFVDLSSDDQQSIGSTLNRLRHLIFLKVKTKLMDAALDQSRCRHNVRYRMYLDRYEAAQRIYAIRKSKSFIEHSKKISPNYVVKTVSK